jgi:NAD(P)-dependent dehydrogenase (short-subunit alcohol dehydrogenase family)
MRLKGKVALVTGGTSGIGRATSLLFAQEGAKVGFTGRDAGRGATVAEEIERAGGRTAFVRADVRSAAECARSVAEVERALGPVDILFNNAGVFFPRSVPETTEEEWNDTIDVSLKGSFLMSKAVLPGMIARRSGVIIHNSSGWGIVGGDRAAAYCAAKGGLVLLTKAMAIDHGRDGIRVNCVCPGDVETPMLPDDARQRGMSWEEYQKGAAIRPLGRIGRPEEIARAVLFLASEDSSFMTGAALVVDGGGTAD